MTIDHGPANRRKSWTMKFEPPMLAGQARKRLEQMHQDARAGLGLVRPYKRARPKEELTWVPLSQSEATIDHFSLGFGDKVTLLISILIWVALLVSPPSLLLSYIPWAANHVRTIISYLGIASSEDRVGHGIKLLLLGPLALIHTAEVFACLFPLMYRFNTSTSSVRTKYVRPPFFRPATCADSEDVGRLLRRLLGGSRCGSGCVTWASGRSSSSSRRAIEWGFTGEGRCRGDRKGHHLLRTS